MDKVRQIRRGTDPRAVEEALHVNTRTIAIAALAIGVVLVIVLFVV
jgi:hypothetical protein